MIKKNIKRSPFPFFIYIITLFSCSEQKTYNNCGIVIFKMMLYDTILKEYRHNELITPDMKIWYKDSIVIMKQMGLGSDANATNFGLNKVVFMHYTFIDLKKLFFYKYGSFTDTAQILESCNEAQSDSGVFRVWKFYRNRTIQHTEPLEIIADTIVDGRNFKRMKINIKLDNDSMQPLSTIAYFDCARKGTIFEMNKEFSEIMGCPMVASYNLPTKKRPITPAGKIEFITDKLTPEELKVFDAWEDNVKKYPVKQ